MSSLEIPAELSSILLLYLVMSGQPLVKHVTFMQRFAQSLLTACPETVEPLIHNYLVKDATTFRKIVNSSNTLLTVNNLIF